jgi:hypothetical protein
MDNETKNRIADYFDAWNLVELLGISTSEIVEAFEELIEERLHEVEEVMGVRREAE